MGAKRILALAVVGAAMLAAPAQASEDDWPVLKGARLDGQMPWGAFAVYRATDASVTGVTLFAREGVLIARRVETRSDAAAAITWASSSSCPQLSTALAALEAFPNTRIEVPLAGRRAKPPVTPPQASSYFLWVQDARQGGERHAGQLELRFVDGAPVAIWMEKTLKSVAGCWTAARP